MKKYLALALVAALVAAPAARAAHQPGGVVGGIVGCCFGVRTAAAYNDGNSLSIRDWLRFIWIVGGVWDAIDGYSGVTTSELATSYPGCY